jgi:hypothetical protein
VASGNGLVGPKSIVAFAALFAVWAMVRLGGVCLGEKRECSGIGV